MRAIRRLVAANRLLCIFVHRLPPGAAANPKSLAHAATFTLTPRLSTRALTLSVRTLEDPSNVDLADTLHFEAPSLS